MKSEHFLKLVMVLKECGYKIKHFEEINFRPEEAQGRTDYIELCIELENHPVTAEALNG
jgi:hypothetical protein